MAGVSEIKKIIKCHRGDSNNCDNSLIELPSYLQHLQTTHKIQECIPKNGSFTLQHTLTNSLDADANWHCMFVRIKERIFIPRLFLRFHILHVALSLIGSDNEAEKFTARISFRQAKDKRPLFETLSSVVPIRVSDAEIAEEWVHPVLTKSMLRSISIGTVNFPTQSLTWQIQYEIITH